MEKRNDKIKAEQDMMIDMDPEIAEIFKASQSVSGKYLYLIPLKSYSVPLFSNSICHPST